MFGRFLAALLIATCGVVVRSADVDASIRHAENVAASATSRSATGHDLERPQHRSPRCDFPPAFELDVADDGQPETDASAGLATHATPPICDQAIGDRAATLGAGSIGSSLPPRGPPSLFAS